MKPAPFLLLALLGAPAPGRAESMTTEQYCSDPKSDKLACPCLRATDALAAVRQRCDDNTALCENKNLPEGAFKDKYCADAKRECAAVPGAVEDARSACADMEKKKREREEAAVAAAKAEAARREAEAKAKAAKKK